MHFLLNRLNTFTLKNRTTQLQQYTCVVIENEVFWDETIGFCILILIGSNKLEKTMSKLYQKGQIQEIIVP